MRRTAKTVLLGSLIVLCAVVALKGAALLVPIGTWEPTMNLAEARANSSAALLSDGRILITGGDGAGGPLATAEFFNSDGSVSPAVPMNAARSKHISVVLQDGRVLVAGGTVAGGGATNAAEIYDPIANAWTSLAGVMTETRSGAIAALLQDQRVFIAGGDNSGVVSATSEIFDPVSGSFTFAAALSSPRTQHAMAVLADGRVLIVGGSNGSAPVASTDIFDPVAGSIAPGPSLTVARSGHSATTLLNGQVLVAGGTKMVTNPDGSTTPVDLAAAEIFDSAAGTFTTSGSTLATSRTGHLAFLLSHNNNVLIVGGTSAGVPVASSELFTPWQGTFSGTGSLATARSTAAGGAMQQDGLLLIAGGKDANGNSLASSELYGFATVKTDASDYAPGSIVTITGSGWQAGETVTLTLVESPLIDTHPTLTAVADASGNIVNAQFSPDTHDLNIRFYLTAVGSNSGFQAQNTFTDANRQLNINSFAITSPAGAVDGTMNVAQAFNVQLKFTGNGSGNWTNVIATLTVPSGWSKSADFGPSSVTAGVQQTVNWTVTPSAAPLASGTVSVSLTGTAPAGDSCNSCPFSSNFPVVSVNPAALSISTFTAAKTGSPGTTSVVVGDSLTVTMTVANGGAPRATANSVSPSELGITPTGTATAGTCMTGSPASANLAAGGSQAYVYTCSPVGGLGTLTFSGSGSGTDQNTAGAVGSPTGNSNIVTVNKATPTIAWNNPADITYGTALSGTQLNATASVPGSFAYTPAVGTVLNPGNGQTLHVDFTPTDTTNYNNASQDVSINILKKNLTVTGITASNKEYDRTTTATLNTGGATLVGAVGGDVVTLNTAGATGTFSDKNVGTGKTVTVNGLTLTGAAAGKYTLTQPTTTADITAKNLTVTGITANNKVYDATTAATLNLGGAVLVGVISGDSVTLVTGNAVGTFSDKNVGTGKTVTISGVKITNPDAANYTLTQPITTANITTKNLTINGAVAQSREYNGSNSATVDFTGASLVGVIAPDVVSINSAGYSATFNNKNVGNGKAVTVLGVALSGTDAGNYTVSQPSSLTANITAKNLTINGAVAQSREYNGSNSATVDFTGASLVGVIAPDVVSINSAGYSATFNNKNVGNGKAVTVLGVALSGTDAGNYTVSQPSGLTANITAKNLTINGAVAQSREYNGSNSATVDFTGASLVGVIAPDVVSINSAGYSATFNNKNVGNGKAVTVLGVALSGTDAGNYTVSQPSGLTANITAKNLTINGAVAQSREYNGSNSATVDFTGASLVGVIAPDVVSINSAGYSATFNDKNVGNGKAVTVLGVALSGTDAGNYTVSQPSGLTANITAKNLTINGAVAQSREYNGSNSATVDFTGASLVGVIAPDVVSINSAGYSATFNNKNVGNGKAVTVLGVALSGTDAGNYTVSQPSSLTANITAKNLTINGAVAQSREYNGSNSATVDFTGASLVGVIAPDVVSINSAGYSATFNDKNVGNGKAVTVLGVALSGTDAGNYTVSQPSSLTANITAKNLTINGAVAQSREYNGSNSATVDFTGASLVGVIAPDVVSINSAGYSATFNDKNVGNGKAVTVLGVALSGTDAGNYTVSQPSSLTANITAKNLTINGAVAQSREYNGSNSATVDFTGASLVGVIAPDVVSINSAGYSATFNDKNVGNGKAVTVLGVALSGTDAGNYTVSQPSSLTANITAKNLTINGAVAQSREYNGSNSATVDFTGASLVGVIAPDVVSINSAGYSASFNDKNVGNGKAVTVLGVALSGTDAGNYTVSQPSGLTANITAKNLTINGAVAQSREYNGSNSATVDFTGASLVGVIAPDVVSINSAGYSATFNDKNVGNGKAVTVLGVVLSGTDAGNYTVSQPSSLTANITAKNLTINGAVAQSREYNGSNSATVDFTGASLVGVIAPDVVSINSAGYSATFNDKNVGNGKAVTVLGVALSGTDAGNYTVSQPSSLTANITARPLTMSATGVNKVYDATTNATVTLSDNRVLGDVLTDSYTSASFVDKNVGTGKNVSVSGISISGTDAGNYSLSNTTATTTANITPRQLAVSATGVNKVYDATTNATVALSDNRVLGDVFTDNYTSASFADKNVGTAKTVSVSGISIAGMDAGNYSLASTSVLTMADITARPITVTADAKSKVLGAADPTLTYKVTSGNLVGTDTFAGGLTRVAGEAVGSYSILQGTLTAGSNYNLTYIGANLTILYAGLGTTCYGDAGHQILQPINANLTGTIETGTSVWKQGSTVPAKFRVCDVKGNSIGNPGVVTGFVLYRINAGTLTAVDELTVDNSTNDLGWRFDPTAQQWIFNMTTKIAPLNNANTTYYFRIDLNDGTSIYFNFGLK